MKDDGTDNSFAHCKADLTHATGWILAMFAVALILTGCAGAISKVETIVVNGQGVVVHIDTFDAPSPCGRSYNHGCHQQINGVHHVWYSAISPPYVRHHEIEGHANKMEHDEYSLHGPFGKDWCARVIVGNEHYPQGVLACVDGRREYFLEGI